MAEYISRKAAIVDFERCNHENPVWTPQRVKTLLMRIPTADVEPVRHGRWKPVYDAAAFRGDPEAAAADEITGYECSICGRTCAFTDGNGEYILPDVCPGCLAKMGAGAGEGPASPRWGQAGEPERAERGYSLSREEAAKA